ncbi:erythromycin esterase family protein [Streptosporangium soli]|nr:erythromycin esterase family protein [Streptosporangium sp. KLBMP 9127]
MRTLALAVAGTILVANPLQAEAVTADRAGAASQVRAGVGPEVRAGVGKEGRAQSASPVVEWVGRHAVPLVLDPRAPLTDLAALRPMVGAAPVVGLGESTHGAREETQLKHRTLRYLVEELGFRSIAWEEDWTVGLEVDRYLRTGKGSLDAVLGRMSTTWRTREVKAVLRWLRDYNAGHADQVRFVGVEFYATGRAAYDAVSAHVARTARGKLPQVRRHLRVIRPDTADMGAYVKWYYSLNDKSPYIRHARELYELVEKLPHRSGDRAHELALHHARQILSFYEYFAQQNLYQYRDRHTAANVRWWRDRTGDKVAYWAALAHTAAAPGFRVSPRPVSFDPAGSYLRRWYGKRYRSIGYTFTTGTLSDATGKPARVPPPPASWADAPFGEAKHAQFALDLRTGAPPEVRRWLLAPAKIRGVVSYDPSKPDEHHGSGSSLSGWFDVIIHRQEVTPVNPLP